MLIARVGHWETTIVKVFDYELALISGVKAETTNVQILGTALGTDRLSLLVMVRGTIRMTVDPYNYDPLTHSFSLNLQENIITYARRNLMIGETYGRENS